MDRSFYQKWISTKTDHDLLKWFIVGTYSKSLAESTFAPWRNESNFIFAREFHVECETRKVDEQCAHENRNVCRCSCSQCSPIARSIFRLEFSIRWFSRLGRLPVTTVSSCQCFCSPFHQLPWPKFVSGNEFAIKSMALARFNCSCEHINSWEFSSFSWMASEFVSLLIPRIDFDSWEIRYRMIIDHGTRKQNYQRIASTFFRWIRIDLRNSENEC